jgi:hypothetical protein
MNLDPFVLLIILIGTLLAGGVSVASARGIWQRLLLVGMFAGLLLYSGIGAAFPDVPHYYLIYYFGFICAFAYAFRFFRSAFAHLSIHSGQALTSALSNVDTHPAWPLVIWIYLLLHLVPLVYPELRLHHLFAPPLPDLLTHFAARWEPQQMNVLMRLVEYARVLLTPFFYIALFRYRQRLSRVAIIFAALLYLQYVAGGYIGRGTILIALVTIWLGLWVARPKDRQTLVVAAVVVVPVFLVFSYYYGIIRIGGSPAGVTPLQAIVEAFENEISFPRNVGVPIIESGARVDLAAYARWMLTLPIPKLLTGEIEGARITYEISEFIFGLGRGERGWYVALPGLVAESVYIYGRYFFWLHAVFIAFLASLVMRLMERTPQLLFLKAYVVVTFAYHLNRGGISGPLGILVNEFMLFYLFVIVQVFGLLRRQRPRGVSPTNMKKGHLTQHNQNAS